MKASWVSAIVVAVVGVVSGLGCGGDAPDCAQAISRGYANMKISDEKLQAFLTTACEKGGWTGDQRKCIAAAKSTRDAASCVPSFGADYGDKMKAATDELNAKHAEAMAQQAVEDAKQAAAKVAGLEKDLEALAAKIGSAVDAVAGAQNDADRTAAKAKLVALQKELADLKARIVDAQAASGRMERAKGVHISKECMDNPLAKGCE